MQIRQRFRTVLFFLVIFAFISIFFIYIHPIPVMDGDDMLYIAHTRPSVPGPTFWNPSRVFPETIMPLAGNMSGIIAAITGFSFIDCQVFITGAVLSLFITVYSYAFFLIIKRRFDPSDFIGFSVTLVFLLLHFLIFRVSETGNRHMFSAYDACCIYFYTCSGLLNLTIVFLLYAFKSFSDITVHKHLTRSAFLFTAVYFAVFSNLFNSVILAAFSFFMLCSDFLNARKAGHNIKPILKADLLLVIILILWIIAALFEALGGRAGSIYEGSTGFTERISMVFTEAALMLKNTNILFLLAVAASAVYAIFCIVIKRSISTGIITLVFSGLVSFLFILLLCAVVDPSYITRPEVIIVSVGVAICLISYAVCHAVSCYSFLQVLIPVAIVFIYSMTNTASRTFADSNSLKLTGQQVRNIENAVCEQIINAASSGVHEAEVYVIRSDDDYANWPHISSIGNIFSEFFLKYGLIDHNVNIITVPSDEFNSRFGYNPYP